MSIRIGLCFLAGLISFLSPCVLSLVPGYLGVLGYESDKGDGKRAFLISGLFFLLGFTTIFLLLGFTATLIGNALTVIKPWIARIGGIILFIFGLQLTGWVNLPFLNYEVHPNIVYGSKNRLIDKYLMGIVFSAGWSPCIGPILGSVLTALAINQVTISFGLFCLFVYSLGFGIPFLLTALGFQTIYKKIVQKKQVIHGIQVASGILLCISGLFLVSGLFSRLAQFASIFSI